MVVYLWFSRYNFSQITIVKDGSELSSHLEIVQIYVQIYRKLSKFGLFVIIFCHFWLVFTIQFTTFYSLKRLRTRENWIIG